MPQPIASPSVDMRSDFHELRGRNEAQTSGISWPAVIGGAFVSAALSLILICLGTGLGFSSVSPWASSGASASTVGAGAIIWLIFTQIAVFAADDWEDRMQRSFD
jgi:hypothetical protein